MPVPAPPQARTIGEPHPCIRAPRPTLASSRKRRRSSPTNSRLPTSAAFNYVKGLFEIAGRSNGESPLRSAFERVEAVVHLTATELETSLRSNLEVTEKLLAQGKKLQQQSYESAKEIADKALSNAKQVVEAASERIESLTDKVEGAEAPAKKKRVPAVVE
jgi:ElaB/YqjD/DUF883 family membrane-anchored ribosome-binding protein